MNQAAASTGKNAALKTQCRLQERGKWAVKHKVHSMQALRPLSDPLQLKLSTWLRSPCPGGMSWSWSSGGSTPLCCSAAPRPTPWHCSSTSDHSDKWPSWQEPWHKPCAHCTGLWQTALQDAAPQTCLPTPLPQLLPRGAAALVPQRHFPKALHCAGLSCQHEVKHTAQSRSIPNCPQVNPPELICQSLLTC